MPSSNVGGEDAVLGLPGAVDVIFEDGTFFNRLLGARIPSSKRIRIGFHKDRISFTSGGFWSEVFISSRRIRSYKCEKEGYVLVHCESLKGLESAENRRQSWCPSKGRKVSVRLMFFPDVQELKLMYFDQEVERQTSYTLEISQAKRRDLERRVFHAQFDLRMPSFEFHDLMGRLGCHRPWGASDDFDFNIRFEKWRIVFSLTKNGKSVVDEAITSRLSKSNSSLPPQKPKSELWAKYVPARLSHLFENVFENVLQKINSGLWNKFVPAFLYNILANALQNVLGQKRGQEEQLAQPWYNPKKDIKLVTPYGSFENLPLDVSSKIWDFSLPEHAVFSLNKVLETTRAKSFSKYVEIKYAVGEPLTIVFPFKKNEGYICYQIVKSNT